MFQREFRESFSRWFNRIGNCGVKDKKLQCNLFFRISNVSITHFPMLIVTASLAIIVLFRPQIWRTEAFDLISTREEMSTSSMQINAEQVKKIFLSSIEIHYWIDEDFFINFSILRFMHFFIQFQFKCKNKLLQHLRFCRWIVRFAADGIKKSNPPVIHKWNIYS